MGQFKNFNLIIFILMSLSLVGCFETILKDPITDTGNILEDAIDSLAEQSEDWQEILEDTLSKLTDESQALIRNEVSNLISRSVAQTGVEFRCNTVFVGDQVRLALIRIKALFLGGDAPPVEPAFCQVVPIAIDREAVPDRVNVLEFYGYNFDQETNLRVSLERRGQSPIDVTNQLDVPTTFAMTLNLGATGVQLDDRSERFVLRFGNEQIASVAVIQPTPKICKTTTTRTRKQSATLVPPRIGGDGDFKGHGPRVRTSVAVEFEEGRIMGRLTMQARETKRDFTDAFGRTFFTLFNAPPGTRITGIISPKELNFRHQYLDDDHSKDEFNFGDGGIISRLVYVGDTRGNEAGTKTKVDATFNPMVVSLTETVDCVPDSTVRALRAEGRISTVTLSALMPDVRREEQRRRDALETMGFRVLLSPSGLVVKP